MLHALDADDGNHVEMIPEKIQVPRSNERAVGKDGEYHIFYIGHMLQDVTPHHGLAAGQKGKVDSKGCSLYEDGFPLLRCQQILLPVRTVRSNAVGPGITTLAMQVAGCGDGTNVFLI